MNELAKTDTQAMTPLNSLAVEAQMYSANVRLNLFNLARVFSEARKLIPHGEWGKWVMENAGVEMRTAQQMIQSYERFGGMPALAKLDRTKLYKMNALPPGTEEAFMEQNDVQRMSTREVEKAVKDFKAQMQAEIDREREARMAAEKRAEEAESRPPQVPEEVTAELNARQQTIQAKDAEIQRLAAMGRETLEESRNLTKENSDLKRDLQESQEMLAEQQEEIARVQGELLNMQSAQARGDAERAPADELTLDVFAGAVRQFMGVCARMPYMNRAFSAMGLNKKSQYNELLMAVEGWCKGAREALECYATEGDVIIG